MSVDEQWFDEMLSSGTESAPDELRAEIRQMVDAAVPPPDLHEMGTRRRRVVTALSLAAVAVLLIGLVAIARDPGTDELVPTGSTPAPRAVSVATTTPTSSTTSSTAAAGSSLPPVATGESAFGDPPTLVARAGESWWIPSALPDGFDFQYAVQESEDQWQIVYGVGNCEWSCESMLIIQPSGLSDPSWMTPLDEAGTVLAHPDYSDRILRAANDKWIEIAGVGMSPTDLADIGHTLELRPESELPRPPFLCCVYVASGDGEPGPLVAEFELDTSAGPTTWQLRAHSDGELIALSKLAPDDSFGPLYRVSDADPVKLGWRPGTYVSPRLPADTGVVYGITSPDVKTLEFLFADGTTMAIDSGDLSGHFVNRFVFAPFPSESSGEAPFDSGWQTITAYDEAGAILAVYDGTTLQLADSKGS